MLGSIWLVSNVEYNSIYHHTKFESNWFVDAWMHANAKLLDAVSETAAIPFVSINLTKK